jgi:transposase
MTQTERRTFTVEFKREAVELSQTSGKPAAQVARELGIRPKLLYRWREEQRAAEQTASDPVLRQQSTLEAENAQLRRELARLQQERDILKKALGIFSQTS